MNDGYKAIIFDLGNVVFHCNQESALNCWSEISGLNKEELKRKLNLDDEIHADFEKSVVSADRFRKHISKQIGYNLSIGEFEQGWNAIYENLVDDVHEFLTQLREQNRIIGLTNTNVTHAKIWKEKYKDTLSLFEKVFASHEIGFRKPEPDAYHVCLDYLEMMPGEVIFLDDNIKNVEAARKVGIKSILVKSFDQMTEDLKQFRINIGE